MQLFDYARAAAPDDAIAAGGRANTAQQGATVRFLAGGTTLYDLMKLDVETPATVVDVNHLPFDQVERTPDGGLRIGALVRNAALANHPDVKRDYAALSSAILQGASAQIRNRATTAGNLLQRTRCLYFRDTEWACNKRTPGSGCSAIHGYNRNLAILGTSDHCIASNPSDMNVALTAFDARVVIRGPRGERTVAVHDFFTLPGDHPEREHVLLPGDLVTHVVLPPVPNGTRSLYLKLRDRASYEFALASAAVVSRVENGRFAELRVAMGGVGTVPWRAREAERMLAGGPVDPSKFRAAAAAVLAGARPQSENGFKVELATRCLDHALRLATAPA